MCKTLGRNNGATSMGWRLLGTGLIASLSLEACDSGHVFCAPLFPEAVAVDVRDSITNASLVETARGAVQAGDVIDSMQVGIAPMFSGPVLVGGGIEGTVEVRVEHAGYSPWVSVDVRTQLSDAGPCPGWDTQPLTARLQPT
jgi:hypothetical protein